MIPIIPPDISNAANNALKNLSDSPTKIIGEMLTDILSIPAIKAKYLSKKVALNTEADFSNFVENLIKKNNLINKEKLVTPNIQIVGNAAENIVYSLNNQNLSDMFASLISNSCNIDYSTIMHPSFSNVIKQLSPYDAILFKELAKNIHTPAVQYKRCSKLSADSTILHSCIPFIESPFDNLDMESTSVSALKHLGLIEYSLNEFDLKPLNRFIECDYFKSLVSYYEHQEFFPTAIASRISLTPYGNSFAIACSLRPV